jgi:hypothetical protein
MTCIECDKRIERIEDATDEHAIRLAGRIPRFSIHKSCEGRTHPRGTPGRVPPKSPLDDIERRMRN